MERKEVDEGKAPPRARCRDPGLHCLTGRHGDPVAPAAAATTCANKTIKIPEEGGKPFAYPVKAVEVSGGATCGEVVSVLTSVISGHPKPGWKGVPVHYELPKAVQEEGLLPMEVKKGSKTIKYAGRGG